MIDQTPIHVASPLHADDHEAGMRLYAMQSAITEFCVQERMNRTWMVRVLNEELRPHNLMVLDLCNWKPKQ